MGDISGEIFERKGQYSGEKQVTSVGRGAEKAEWDRRGSGSQPQTPPWQGIYNTQHGGSLEHQAKHEPSTLHQTQKQQHQRAFSTPNWHIV